MIKTQNLIKKFNPHEAAVIKDVNLEIKNGDFISLMGRSGSGKSTLLYMLSTLDRHFVGNIFYDGKDICKMSIQEIHQIRNKQIGFVFQFHYLLSELTAIENILLPARKAGLLMEKESFARELLQTVGLQDKADRLPANLSGGEQQRVAIARALIMKPQYIFADEPTGNLDSTSGDIILELFAKFNQEYKTTIIFVTHDEEFGNRAPRKIKLVDGMITQDLS
ncbi:MAG: ABC transporter ATP-binding protein [Bacteriovoracaceae bacterium]|nr:ABC transporter ATP-binding protein [Bacteriovoracaceae bacterium]